MKKLIYFLVCLLLCVSIGGGAFLLYKSIASSEKTPTTQGGNTTVNDGEEGVTDFDDPPVNTPDGTDNPDDSTGAGTELTPPEDEKSYIAEGLTMMGGASVYMGTDASLDPAIRFTCLIDNELKAQVEADENKSLAILVAPLDYFDAVNAESSTYVDWVNEFAKAGKTVALGVFDDYGEYNDYTSFMRFNLSNVLYSNMNRRFVAMGVLIDNSGETPTYTYSAMPAGQTYRTNARSVAYVAGAALNARAMGLDNFSEAHAAKLREYIDMAIDQANGLSSYVKNGDMPEVMITNATSVKMGVNGTHTIQGTLEPENLDVPVKFVSSNEAVAVVSEAGVIYSRVYGSATITMYLAGEAYTVSVTVSSDVQYM